MLFLLVSQGHERRGKDLNSRRFPLHAAYPAGAGRTGRSPGIFQTSAWLPHSSREKNPMMQIPYILNGLGFDPRRPDDRVVMVRDGDWKLSFCVDAREEKGELINLREDPCEQRDLFGLKEAEIFQEFLTRLIDDHIQGTEEPLKSVTILDELVRMIRVLWCVPHAKGGKSGIWGTLIQLRTGRRGSTESFSCGHCGTRFGLIEIISTLDDETDLVYCPCSGYLHFCVQTG